MLLKLPSSIFYACALAALTACGGGGGGGGSTATAAGANSPASEPAYSGPRYTLSGSALIQEALAADYDSNDTLSASGLRNNPEDPQQPPGMAWPQQIDENPVRISGYVRAAAPGGIGFPALTPDTDDYYRIQLKAGQVLRLDIIDHQQADLDLYLYDGAGQRIVDGALGVAAREELEIIFDREYVINVFAWTGGSTYQLSIVDPVVGASLHTPALTGDFRPGELLVEMHADEVESADTAQDKAGRKKRARRQGKVKRLRTKRLQSQSAKRGFVSNDLRDKFDTLMQLKSVSARADVKRAEPNYLLHASAMPNDPNYYKQWHFPIINLPDAWDMTTGARPGHDVIVAVLDTGIAANHPDLDGQLVPGYDFVASIDVALDGDGIDPDPVDPVVYSQLGTTLSSFHGTHVAGTIAAASNNEIGVAGIAWQARVMPVRVLGENSSGTVYDVLQGVRYAAGLPNDSGRLPAQPADIINLSLTGTVYSQIAETTYAEARAAGAILVAAGGNRGSGGAVYPAGYPSVLGVGAVGANKYRLSYSSYGSGIDLVAPGGVDFRDDNFDGLPDVIYSTMGNLNTNQKKADYNYGYKSGTSMSAAHVSGVIALMEAVDPEGNLTPGELDSLLRSGLLTEDLGAPGRDDYYGHGLIDAYRAVLAAAGGVVTAPPALDVAPRQLELGQRLDVAEFTLFNMGGGSLDIYSAQSSAGWLTLESPLTGDGLGVYTLRLDRSLLAPGDHQASIQISSSAGPLTLQVGVSHASAEQLDGRSAGLLHVYLVEVSGGTEVVRAEVTSSASAGAYRFNIGNVAGGRSYRLVASTDHDNDGDLCDEGEACARSDTFENLDSDQVGIELSLEL